MRRAAATLAVATLALTVPASAPRVTPLRLFDVYLPRVEQRAMQAPTAAPTATPAPPRTIIRPADAGALIDALASPGALVLPAPGTYHLPVQARVAIGTTVNGRQAARITGHGLMLDEAHGAELHGLTIEDVKGDGLTVHGGRVLLADMEVARATDGLLDLNGGAWVEVHRTLFRDGQPRGLLCGNWQKPLDGRERLILVEVTFRDVPARTPKLQDCDLVATDLTVTGAAEHYPLDLRGSSTAILTRYFWMGGKIRAPGWRADAGARVEVR